MSVSSVATIQMDAFALQPSAKLISQGHHLDATELGVARKREKSVDLIFSRILSAVVRSGFSGRAPSS